MSSNLKALILAGGEGTRLRPITYEIPKALLMINEKTITEHLFDLFKKYEIRNIILSVGYLKEKIKDYFGNGRKFGVNLDYIEEISPLGTAGPVKKAYGILSEQFMVSNGDELKDINLEDMLSQHEKEKGLATIALTSVGNPQDYGVARLDGNKILEFVEKPKLEEAPSRFINAGFYIMQKDILPYIKEGFCMFERDVFPVIAKEGNLYGYNFKGQWFDTGNMKRYENAVKNWQGIK